jgi:hypothetical protein
VSDSVAVLTSLVGAGAALLGAGVGGWVTYFVTGRAVRAAATEAERNRAHEQAQAWAEREQTRKFDTYVAVARYVLDWQRQVEHAVKQASFRTDPPTPPPQQDSIGYALEAQAALTASAEVHQLLHEFNRLIVLYSTAVGSARQMAAFADGPVPDPTMMAQAAQAKNAANEAGRAALNAGDPLLARMREELNGDGATNFRTP